MKQERQTQIVVQKLIKVAILSIIFMTVQIVGGIYAGSIAILADAFHLLSDVMAYAISLFAVIYSKKLAPSYLTFGYQKLQPLGALANVAIIWIVTVQLCVEATSRIINKDVVYQPWIMLGTSIFGLCCNLIIMKILHSDPDGGHHCNHSHGDQHKHSHNHSHSHSHNHKNSEIENQSHHEHIHDSNHKCSGSHKKKEKKHSQCKNNINNTMKRQLLVEEQTNRDDNEQKIGQKQNHNENLNKNPMNDEVGQQMKKDLINQSETASKQSNDTSSESSDHEHADQQDKKFNNINIQAAYIHIISDIILSIGVIVSAATIVIFTHTQDDGTKTWTAWELADPFCTYFFSIMAIYSTIKITKQSVVILLDGCDKPHLVQKVKKQLKQLISCKQILSLKVWSANRGKYYGAVKVLSDDKQKFIKDSKKIMKRRNIDCYIDVSQGINQ